jgi:hypothetical protein
MCEYPQHGCPLATLAPELARVDTRMKPQIVAELVNYKSRTVPFMPGRRTKDKERAFFTIFFFPDFLCSILPRHCFEDHFRIHLTGTREGIVDSGYIYI